MNNDSDNTQNLLLWLLCEFGPTFSIPSGNGSTSEAIQAEVNEFGVGSDAKSTKPAHQKGSEEASSYPSTSSSASLQRSFLENSLQGECQPRNSAASRATSPAISSFLGTMASSDRLAEISSQTAQSFNFGEIHAVQERFQALLKQRLLSEYESNPPLFPWESEISEYPAEVTECVPATAGVPSIATLWSTHVSALRVPGLLPAPLMTTLLERCQEIARSPIKQGVRLVRAVEDLFPESADMLEPIANMVLVPAYRSGRAAQDAVIQELANAAGGYSSALPEQQIALSMMAAQEILGALTFSVNAQNTSEQRSWITAVGALELTAHYKAAGNPDARSANDQNAGELKVVAVLPEGGKVRLRNGDVEKVATRSRPGPLDLCIANPVVGKTYVMEVSLQNEAQALTFAIQVEAPTN